MSFTISVFTFRPHNVPPLSNPTRPNRWPNAILSPARKIAQNYSPPSSSLSMGVCRHVDALLSVAPQFCSLATFLRAIARPELHVIFLINKAITASARRVGRVELLWLLQLIQFGGSVWFFFVVGWWDVCWVVDGYNEDAIATCGWHLMEGFCFLRDVRLNYDGWHFASHRMILFRQTNES